MGKGITLLDEGNYEVLGLGLGNVRPSPWISLLELSRSGTA